MADKVKVLNAMGPLCLWQFLPSRVVWIWMNCIGAISFQRSWKAHITHLAGRWIFSRDFGGFKFLTKSQQNTKQYSHQHHRAPSPQGLWQRSPYWLGMVESIEILSSIEDFWSRCFPLTLCTCTLYTPVPTNITWPDHMVSDFDSCSHLDLVSSYTICQLN